MEEILVKYLLKEANEAEQRTVAEWLSATEENRRYFEQMEWIWVESKLLAMESKVDEQEAWLRFREQIQANQSGSVQALAARKTPVLFRAAAAVLLLVLGAWMAYLFADKDKGLTTLASGENVLTDTLPDGSVITLNKHSTITYPGKFYGNSRPVVLEGEAFFNVAPDKKKPFLITVGDVSVTVVGTSFNVKSTNKHTEVTVETGIVTVSKQDNKVKLLPKQKAVIAASSDKPIVEKNEDDLYNYYRTKEFVCNHTPLWKLVEALNTAYGARIVIGNNSIKNLPLTTTFRNASLQQILNTVVATFNLRIEQKDGKIILDG